MRSHRLVWPRTQAFQAWYVGSNPAGSIKNVRNEQQDKSDKRDEKGSLGDFPGIAEREIESRWEH